MWCNEFHCCRRGGVISIQRRGNIFVRTIMERSSSPARSTSLPRTATNSAAVASFFRKFLCIFWRTVICSETTYVHMRFMKLLHSPHHHGSCWTHDQVVHCAGKFYILMCAVSQFMFKSVNCVNTYFPVYKRKPPTCTRFHSLSSFSSLPLHRKLLRYAMKCLLSVLAAPAALLSKPNEYSSPASIMTCIAHLSCGITARINRHNMRYFNLEQGFAMDPDGMRQEICVATVSNRVPLFLLSSAMVELRPLLLQFAFCLKTDVWSQKLGSSFNRELRIEAFWSV